MTVRYMSEAGEKRNRIVKIQSECTVHTTGAFCLATDVEGLLVHGDKSER
jgi:hypothetical protein